MDPVEVMRGCPEYSLEFVNAAKELIGKYNCEEEDILDICGTDAYKAEMLLEYMNYTNKNDTIIPFDFVFKEGKPNASVMRIRFLACTRGADIEKIRSLTDTKIPTEVINFLVQGCLDGYDMEPYKEFSADQVCEIYSGMKNGIDPVKYTDIRISADKMGVIRHALEMKLSCDVVFDTHTDAVTIIIK